MQKQWDKAWEKLSREEQDRYLTILWRDGYTEQAIANFFRGATKGRIVRRRQTGLRLTTEGRGKVKTEVGYDRFVDLLDIDKMDDLEEKHGGNVVCIAPLEETPRDPVIPGTEEVAVSKQVETPTTTAEDSPPSVPEEPKIERPIVRTEKTPRTSTLKVSKQPETPACKWPLASGGPLKDTKLCGEPALPGEEVCEKHKNELRKLLPKR